MPMKILFIQEVLVLKSLLATVFGVVKAGSQAVWLSGQANREELETGAGRPRVTKEGQELKSKLQNPQRNSRGGVTATD